MRISDLPIAINYAKPASQLTQYQPGSSGKVQTVSGGNSALQVTFIPSLISSDNGYTKQDAILKEYSKAGFFNLYDVLSGTGTIKLQSPNPSAEELQALEKTLQENGIQSGISFELSNFAFDLRGIGFGTNNPIYQLDGGDLSKKTDYLASRYAAMQA